MKAARCISVVLVLGIATASVGMTVLLTGCQTSGKVLSAETSSVCPMCKTQTVTAPIKGLTYTKHVCPSCRTETTLDPKLEETLRGYVGISSDIPTVHVCDHCKEVVEKCPVCRKAAAGK